MRVIIMHDEIKVSQSGSVYTWEDFFIFWPVVGSSADIPQCHFGGLSQYDLGKWGAPQQQSLGAKSTNWSSWYSVRTKRTSYIWAQVMEKGRLSTLADFYIIWDPLNTFTDVPERKSTCDSRYGHSFDMTTMAVPWVACRFSFVYIRKSVQLVPNDVKIPRAESHGGAAIPGCRTSSGADFSPFWAEN